MSGQTKTKQKLNYVYFLRRLLKVIHVFDLPEADSALRALLLNVEEKMPLTFSDY